MAKFADRHGREWLVEVVTGDLARLQKEFGIVPRIDNQQLDKTLSAVLDDYEKLGSLLTFLCREQIEKLNLTLDQFASGLNADALDDAAAAIIEAVVDFSPRSRGVRAAMRKHLRKSLTEIDRQMEAEVEKRLSMSSESAGSLAENLESIPGRTRSDT